MRQVPFVQAKSTHVLYQSAIFSDFLPFTPCVQRAPSVQIRGGNGHILLVKRKRAGTWTGYNPEITKCTRVWGGYQVHALFRFRLKYNDSYGSGVETDASTLCKYIGGYHPGIPTEGCSIATKLPGTGGTMCVARHECSRVVANLALAVQLCTAGSGSKGLQQPPRQRQTRLTQP